MLIALKNHLARNRQGLSTSTAQQAQPEDRLMK
jgi:hypothetical protein